MKLVIGYLATPGGADALALGLRFARSMGAEVEICLILPPARLPALGGSPAGYEKLIAERTDTWIADALAQVPDGVVARGHRYIAESFAEGLISEVVRLQADLLVVGGSGGGLAGSRSLGSVVNELLYSAPVPVAVAPRGLRESRVDRVGGITCAIGERAGADLLLDTAVRFGAAAEAPLRLVSLVALDPVFGSLRGDADAARQHAVTHALRTLEQAKDELPKGFPVTSSVLEGQSVEDAVAQLTWHDGDIIMVGSSRLSAPRRLFLGSTAAKMLRVLDVPMIVVPRDQLSEEDLP